MTMSLLLTPTQNSSLPQPTLSVWPIQTQIFCESMDLHEFVLEHVGEILKEGMVLAITSKLFSVAEKRFVSIDSISKRELIEKDCDHFLCETSHGVTLTIKDGLVIPSSGIDESNSENGHYLLYPENPYASTQALHGFLTQHLKIKNLGVIMTDSHTSALRKGVKGIGLAHYGFNAIFNLVGTEDLFGRKIKMTSVNVLDSLSVATVLTMGEASERCPLAIAHYRNIEFTHGKSIEETKREIQIPLDEDLYGPLLTALKK